MILRLLVSVFVGLAALLFGCFRLVWVGGLCFSFVLFALGVCLMYWFSLF